MKFLIIDYWKQDKILILLQMNLALTGSLEIFEISVTVKVSKINLQLIREKM